MYRNVHAYNARDTYRETAEDAVYVDRSKSGREIGLKRQRNAISVNWLALWDAETMLCINPASQEVWVQRSRIL